MNKLITLLSLGLMSLSFPLLASGHFQVNEQLSTVNFASIKKQYVVEPAVITGVSGKIDTKGSLELTVPLNMLDTGVSIRNDRLRALFFMVWSTKFKNNTELRVKANKFDLLLSNSKEYVKIDGGYLKMYDGSSVPISTRKKSSVLKLLQGIV